MEQAEECYQRSVAIRREFRDTEGEAHTLLPLASLKVKQGNNREAVTLLQEAISIFDKIGALHEMKQAQTILADAEASLTLQEARNHISAGAWQLGLNEARKALEQFRVLEDKRGKAGAFMTIGDAHLKFGDYEIALTNFKDAERHFRQLGDERGAIYARFKMGNVEALLNDSSNASRHLQEATAYFRDHAEEQLAQMGERLLQLTRTSHL